MMKESSPIKLEKEEPKHYVQFVVRSPNKKDFTTVYVILTNADKSVFFDAINDV